jgi:transcriptional regulator with XRE-family HTH domain
MCKEEIKRRGYKLYEVAKALYISERTLYTYCIGQRPIPRDTLERLAALLECPTSVLIDYPVPSPPQMLSSALSQVPLPGHHALPSLLAHTQDIIEEASGEETNHEQIGRYSLNPLRRQLLGAMPLIGEAIVHPAILERLTRVFAKPARIDERSLAYLHKRTAIYWQDRNTDAAPVLDLLDDVTKHLDKILMLLEWPHLPTIRTYLCAIAGETSLLVGALLFELGAYAQARAYFQNGVLQAAREASYPELEAIGWGWISFTWTYDGKMKQALACVQQGRRLLDQGTRTAISTWLAAIEAEIQARLGVQDACLKALGEAEYIETVQYDSRHLGDELVSQFNVQKLAGYQGICYRLLYKPQVTSTTSFLVKAQSILQETLAHVAPTELRRQAVIHPDLASTYAQQKECEQAYKHAMQALLITEQTKSGVAVQRLLTLRRELEPWKDTLFVRAIDECLEPLLGYRQRRTLLVPPNE